MPRTQRIARIIVLILPIALPSRAVELSTQRIPRASSAVAVDGVLNEQAWVDAWSMELAYEVQPGENIPPPVRTEVLATYDERSVYFAFRAFDPEPDTIRAHLSDRDSVGSDDWVALILDTFNDQRRSFDFLVNPLGVQSDFVETSSGDESWDAIWDSAGRITDWGYAVEIRIPFSSLRFQRVNGPQVWGFDAVRSYPRSVRHHIGLFPRDRNNNCYLCQAIRIEGFEGVSPGRNLEVVPTLTATRTDSEDPAAPGRLIDGNIETDAGVTGRWGVTPNLTLAGTLYPDFSQVEADARQLDINEPFALFFEEKRPFFMEGADFFATPFDVVYTRTIRDPSWGLKLTGKEGSDTLGGYVVEDDLTNLIFPSSQSSQTTSLDQPASAAVLRYKRDLGDQYTLGALATAREGTGYHNRVLGFDADLRFTDRDRLQAQVLGSSTRYPDEVAADFGQPAGDFEDLAADLLYVHATRSFDAWARYRTVGPDFRADLGFMPMVDLQRAVLGADYTWYPRPESWFSVINLEGETWQDLDHDRDLLQRMGTVIFSVEGQLQSHSFVRLLSGREAYSGVEFDRTELSLHVCLKPDGHSHAYLNLTAGDRIDYANTRPGERLRAEGGLLYRLGVHLSLDVDHLYERMEVDQGWLYTANISQGTFAYQFTTRCFLRAILQYVDYRYDPELYTDGRDAQYRDLFTQLLFSYKLNPQTVFFLGYSDRSLAGPDQELTRTSRTLFAKIGYAFVF